MSSIFLLNNVLIKDNTKCSSKETANLVVRCSKEDLNVELLNDVCANMDIDVLESDNEYIDLSLNLSGSIPILSTINLNQKYLFKIKANSSRKVRVLEIEELEPFSFENNKIDVNSTSTIGVDDEDIPEPDDMDKNHMKNELLEKISIMIDSLKTNVKSLKSMQEEINKKHVNLKTLNKVDNYLNELFEKNNILHYK
jgi:hypothetical protein|uniref:Uncharacterized protein n=1 Tax=viral metagenome TaxID=1070528 RepID=A0A6C0BR32_9ZZZZ